jgi:hypothetical protein
VDPRKEERWRTLESMGRAARTAGKPKATDTEAMLRSIVYRPRQRSEMRAATRPPKEQSAAPVEIGRAEAMARVEALEAKARGDGEYVALAADRFLAWAQRALGRAWGPEFPTPETHETLFFDIAYGVDVRRFLDEETAAALDGAVAAEPWTPSELRAALGGAEALLGLDDGGARTSEDARLIGEELDRLEARGVVGRLTDIQTPAQSRRPLLHRLFVTQKGRVMPPTAPDWTRPWDAANEPRREDGKRRLVADLRAFNACCPAGNGFAYETADDIFDFLSRRDDTPFLSKTDIVSGYHCVRTAPECAHLLAFRHPANGEIYAWRRWPFGIKQGPAVFSLVTAVVADAFTAACEACGVADAPRPFCYIDDLTLVDDKAATWMGRLRSFLAYLNLPTAAAKTEEGRRRITHLGWSWECDENGVSVRPTGEAALKAARAVAVLAQQVVRRGLAPAWLVEHTRGVCIWVATVKPAARSRIRGFGRALKCPRQNGLVATDAKRVATDLDYWCRLLGLGSLRSAAEWANRLDEAKLARDVSTATAGWTRRAGRAERSRPLWIAASDGGDNGYALHAWPEGNPAEVSGVAGRVEVVDAVVAELGGEAVALGSTFSSTLREVLPLLAWLTSDTAPRAARITWCSDSQAAVYAVSAASSRGVFIDTLLGRIFDALEALGSSITPTWRPRELNAGQDVCADDPSLGVGGVVLGPDFVRSALRLPTVPLTRPSPVSPWRAGGGS